MINKSYYVAAGAGLPTEVQSFINHSTSSPSIVQMELIHVTVPGGDPKTKLTITINSNAGYTSYNDLISAMIQK